MELNREQIEEIDEVLSECTYDNELKSEMALKLYEAGYRKASDVAREIFTEIEGGISLYAYTTDCDTFYNDRVLDALVWVDSKIDEIKKKYTEAVE